jgi:membrane protein
MREWLGQLWRLILRAVLNFHRDNCLNLAAAVAFYSLLSLAPLIYLAGSLLQLFFGSGEGLDLAIDRLTAFLPAEIQPAVDRIAPGLHTEGGFVLVAVPVLLWVGTTVFSALESAINVAFVAGRRGSLWRGRVKAFAILGVGCAVLLAALAFRGFIALRTEYGALFSLPEPTSGMAQLLSYLGLMGASFLTFLLFFKWLPRTRVGWCAAGAGALFALVLWDVARRVFGGFLLRSPAFGLLTGTLAGIVGFLLWIYTAVAIFMLGAELAALVNRSRANPGRT